MTLQNLKNFFTNFYNIYLTGLSFLIALPILAPMFMYAGMTQIAKIIYFIYSFFCHQIAYRSIHLYDFQFAWCARDTGIWFGIWIVALLIKLKKLKGIKWYWLIPFVIPIALDGGIQTIFTILNISSRGILTGLPVYMSTNLTRFMTGAIFGIGLSLWLSPMILSDAEAGRFGEDAENSKPENKSSRYNQPGLLGKLSNFLQSDIFKTQKFKVFFLCILMFPLYFLLFSLWNSTSEANKPLEPLDFVVKAPQQDFLIRRENAICPTNGFQDLLSLDCFLLGK